MAAPPSYPFQILAGSSSPMLRSGAQQPHQSEPFDCFTPHLRPDGTVTLALATQHRPVTFVGFLQVFINAVDQFGNVRRDGVECGGLRQRKR